VMVPVPPAPVTGMNDVAAVFCVSVRVGMTWVATSALDTAKVNVWLAVARVASVTVTVYEAAAAMAVGVPVMAPVVVLNERPAGSVPLML
jgi:hypothetical protein